MANYNYKSSEGGEKVPPTLRNATFGSQNERLGLDITPETILDVKVFLPLEGGTFSQTPLRTRFKLMVPHPSQRPLNFKVAIEW